jgi:hypothetical protein
MTDDAMQMNRRNLLLQAAMLLGGALSSGTAMGVLAGCAATPQASQSPAAFLTPSEMRLTTVMADLILPRTDTPGASDVGVPAFIDRVLAEFYSDQERTIVRAGLARAESEARTAHGRGFHELDAAQQTALMTVYDREAVDAAKRASGQADSPPHFFRLIKELTTVGFFTSKVGASQVLLYEAVPGPWRGDVPYSEIGRAWAS